MCFNRVASGSTLDREYVVGFLMTGLLVGMWNVEIRVGFSTVIVIKVNSVTQLLMIKTAHNVVIDAVEETSERVLNRACYSRIRHQGIRSCPLIFQFKIDFDLLRVPPYLDTIVAPLTITHRGVPDGYEEDLAVCQMTRN